MGEKGSDELLLEIVYDDEIMAPVRVDDERRAREEKRVSDQPSDGDQG